MLLLESEETRLIRRLHQENERGEESPEQAPCGVTLLPPTWHPFVPEGCVNTISISLVGGELPQMTDQSMS